MKPLSVESFQWRRQDLSFGVGVLVVQAALVLSLWGGGFTAISDDDAARVVIAQGFAENPSLEPSGTSWLPIPFLMSGSLMWFTEGSLEMARLSALISALGASALLFAAARILGASPLSGAVAVVFGASLPLSRHLAAATVPEYLTAACVVFAASTLNPSGALSEKQKGALAFCAGAAFFVACGSRYEPWPAAGAFAIILLLSARNGASKFPQLVGALIGGSFPLIWLMHGWVTHGDPLFFLKRVVDYKVALGADGSLVDALLTYPRALLLAEPEGVLALLFASVALMRPSTTAKTLAFPGRAGIPIAVLVLFLIVGAARDGAPTHHPERALLSCYLFCAVVAGALWEKVGTEARTKVSLLLAVGATLGLILRSSGAYEQEPYVNRKSEEAVGRWLASHLPKSEKVALALVDYGYFSVMAAAQGPKRFEVLEKHDPRESASADDRNAKLARFRNSGGCFWVQAPAAEQHGAVRVHEVGTIGIYRGADCSEDR